MTVENTVWQQRATAAQERREKQLPDEYRIPKDKMPDASVKNVMNFPRESGLLSTEELEITELSVPALLKAIEDKKWTAVQVTKAYCKRAAYAQQLLNCLSEMVFDRAIAEAQELDDYYEANGKLKGSLHGLPVSIKDNHLLKGTTSGVGFTSWTTTIHNEDSVIAQLLMREGAIIYCKTTVPMAMLSVETESRVYGLTMNPWNRTHTAGGSSGGEGALSAFGGSPVGLGSDIGGSIRVPANYNGIYGIRGTIGRIPTAGTLTGLPGQFHIKSVAGPMARTLESVELIAKLLYNSNPERLDENCVPMPWREPVLPKKLVFGVIRSDKVCRPTPAVTRALEKAIEAVKAQGHEVIEWDPVDVTLAGDISMEFFTADGGDLLKDSMEDEPALEHQFGSLKLKPVPSSRIWAAQRERTKIEKAVLAQWNKSCNLSESGQVMDGIISPVSAVPAYPHRQPFYVTYTSYWNLVDYPSVAFPVLKADASIDGKPEIEYITKAEKQLWDGFDPVACDGGCVGLQIITRRFEDEKALKLAGVISDALKKL
ncbi:amidase signature domain-containing protein [Umbelopsis sp. AD052]|nr:amidase signature domain-containing protein [Umbelopsis sp. AD052]